MLMWLNRSVVIINVTLQLIYIKEYNDITTLPLTYTHNLFKTIDSLVQLTHFSRLPLSNKLR